MSNRVVQGGYRRARVAYGPCTGSYGTTLTEGGEGAKMPAPTTPHRSPRMNEPKKENPTPESAAAQPEAPAQPENAYRPPGMPSQEDIEKLQQQQKLHMERMQQAHQSEQPANVQTLTYIQRQLMGDPSNDIQPDPLISALISDINVLIAQVCRYSGAEYRPFLALDIFNAFCMPDWQNEWQQPWKPVTPPRYAPYISDGRAEQALDARAAAIFGTPAPQGGAPQGGAPQGGAPQGSAPQAPQGAQSNPGAQPGHKRNKQFRTS